MKIKQLVPSELDSHYAEGQLKWRCHLLSMGKLSKSEKEFMEF